MVNITAVINVLIIISSSDNFQADNNDNINEIMIDDSNLTNNNSNR